MSEVISTGFKKQSCGDMHQLGQTSILKDVNGGLVDLQLIGTDPNVGVIIGTAMTENYSPDPEYKNADGTFFICIETSGGVYHVRLADGSEFTITAVQSAAYAGIWYPAKISEVLIGTTGDFSVGY